MTDDEARAILCEAYDDGKYLPFNPRDPEHEIWDAPDGYEPIITLDDYYTLSQIKAILHFAPKDWT